MSTVSVLGSTQTISDPLAGSPHTASTDGGSETNGTSSEAEGEDVSSEATMEDRVEQSVELLDFSTPVAPPARNPALIEADENRATAQTFRGQQASAQTRLDNRGRDRHGILKARYSADVNGTAGDATLYEWYAIVNDGLNSGAPITQAQLADWESKLGVWATSLEGNIAAYLPVVNELAGKMQNRKKSKRQRAQEWNVINNKRLNEAQALLAKVNNLKNVVSGLKASFEGSTEARHLLVPPVSMLLSGNVEGMTLNKNTDTFEINLSSGRVSFRAGDRDDNVRVGQTAAGLRITNEDETIFIPQVVLVELDKVEFKLEGGDDQFFAEPGVSIPIHVDGGTGNNRISGGSGDDVLTATRNSGINVFSGNLGNDTIKADEDDIVTPFTVPLHVEEFQQAVLSGPPPTSDELAVLVQNLIEADPELPDDVKYLLNELRPDADTASREDIEYWMQSFEDNLTYRKIESAHAYSVTRELDKIAWELTLAHLEIKKGDADAVANMKERLDTIRALANPLDRIDTDLLHTKIALLQEAQTLEEQLEISMELLQWIQKEIEFQTDIRNTDIVTRAA